MQQATANTEKVSFVAALLTTDRRVTGQARVFAFCTALFSCLVCVHSVQERISLLKTPKHRANQSLMGRTVKKNPDLTHRRKMTKQTLAVWETTKQATSMTKLETAIRAGSTLSTLLVPLSKGTTPGEAASAPQLWFVFLTTDQMQKFQYQSHPQN